MTISPTVLDTLCQQFEALHAGHAGNGNGKPLRKGMTRIMALGAARALEETVAYVPRHSYVTVEGTPMYMDKKRPWDDQHELGTNILLAHARTLLEAKECHVEHYALLDDFTGERTAVAADFIDKMRDRPQNICYEAAFVDEAENHIRRFTEAGRTREHAMTEEVFLWTGTRGPLLRVKSGRPSCGILDACYQTEKSRHESATGRPTNQYHVLIHPSSFVPQQADMRDILREIHDGRLPGAFINLFFHKSTAYQVHYTPPDGNTRGPL